MMTAPEQKPEKNRPQILDDTEERMKAAVEALEKENRSLKDLVVQLSELVVRKVTGKK